MSEHSAIGWTHATWNPVTGCSRVSPGCEHCYAELLSLRMGWSTKPWTNQNAAENVKLHPERLSAPLRWRKPRKVFVNSMSDLFHELVPIEFIARVFDTMACATVDCDKRHEHTEECWTGPSHIFQVLTKRPDRMRAVLNELPDFLSERWPGDRPIMAALETGYWPLPNVWLGVSAEDQRRWDERVEILGRVPAAVRFVSAEPLLGPVDAGNAFDPPIDGTYQPVDWVIIGGETGPAYRPMEVAWAESLARQCQLANVACFVKQDSGPRPGKQGRLPDEVWAHKAYPRTTGSRVQ